MQNTCVMIAPSQPRSSNEPGSPKPCGAGGRSQAGRKRNAGMTAPQGVEQSKPKPRGSGLWFSNKSSQAAQLLSHGRSKAFLGAGNSLLCAIKLTLCGCDRCDCLRNLSPRQPRNHQSHLIAIATDDSVREAVKNVLSVLAVLPVLTGAAGAKRGKLIAIFPKADLVRIIRRALNEKFDTCLLGAEIHFYAFVL